MDRVGPGGMAFLSGRRLLVVALVAMIAVASASALAVYQLSLHIASTNSDARALDARLLEKRQEVRQLRQELDIRSRFTELERWGPTLGLRPAGQGQYVTDMHQLGSAAAARRQQMALAGPAPDGGRQGYTPDARKALDGLIGDVMR